MTTIEDVTAAIGWHGHAVAMKEPRPVIDSMFRQALVTVEAYAAEQGAAALKERNEPRPMSKGESEAIDRALACLNGGARSVTVLYTDDTPTLNSPAIQSERETGEGQ